MSRPTRIALVYWQSKANSTLSYQHGWPLAFIKSPFFDCTPINLAQAGFFRHVEIARFLRRGQFEAIVFLHSVFSNQQNLRRIPLWLFSRCPQPKAFFIGNEYKLMPEKINFCRELDLSLLVTQSNDSRVKQMYASELGCHVTSIPSAGFDPAVFYPKTRPSERRIDIGYRALITPLYFGNNEKAEIGEFFLSNATRLKLRVDISMDAADRFDANGYASFLNRCRSQIGTESGTDFFELTDATRLRVNEYVNQNPKADWPTIKLHYFDKYGPSVPMRIISGRQVEAAACKTVQILYRGRYNDFLRPNIHYIPLSPDFSDIDDAMRKFRDNAFCAEIVANAYDVVMNELRYERLVEMFSDALSQVL